MVQNSPWLNGTLIEQAKNDKDIAYRYICGLDRTAIVLSKSVGVSKNMNYYQQLH